MKVYGQKKLEKIVGQLKSKMEAVHETKIKSTSEADIDYLVERMKEKMGTTTKHQDKIKILTVAPKSWSYAQLSHIIYFHNL